MDDQTAIAANHQTIVAWMTQHITSVLDLPKDDFNIDERFDSYGLDSVEAVIMAGLMEEEFALPIDPMTLFEHPSVSLFADFLAPQLPKRA